MNLSTSHPIVPFLVAAALVLGMVVAVEAGYRLGRKAKKSETDKSQIGAVQGAVLGLLGLLLGFSFAGAGARFIERQDIIVREANAVGTAWLRADLLDEPSRTELRSALRAHTDERVALSGQYRMEDLLATVDRMQALESKMWSAAASGVAARPQFANLVVPAVNEVIDLQTTRNASFYRHIPSLVMWLLVISAAAALGVVGYGCGLTAKRNFEATTALAVLIAIALWATIDLDHPRRGLIKMNYEPLKWMDESLR